MTLYYLASPYSKFPGGLDEAAKQARFNAGLLLSAGLDVFSPIAHSHDVPVDRHDYDLWLRLDKAIASRCDALIVLTMDGWDSSYGVTQERAWFKEWEKPIHYMVPGMVDGLLVSIAA